METKIIQIGNSMGIIIPQRIAAKLDLKPKESVNLIERDGCIRIETSPRFGWEAKIKEYSLNNQQELAIPDILNDEFEEDWQW